MKTKAALFAALFAVAAAPAFAQGDAAAGEKVFNKCKACHMVGPDAKNRVGPALTGVVGVEIAHVEDFKYSDNFMELKAEGYMWTPENLSAYLTDPKAVAPKGKMSFAGLRKQEEIDNVVAYLATFQ